MARTYGHGTNGQPTSLWCCNACKHYFKTEKVAKKAAAHYDAHKEDINEAYSK